MTGHKEQTQAPGRAEKRAAALRENLKRRKLQQKERGKDDGGSKNKTKT
jgi:hypothetical protein